MNSLAEMTAIIIATGVAIAVFFALLSLVKDIKSGGLEKRIDRLLAAPQRKVTIDEIAAFEKTLVNGDLAIILAHQIEQPKDELRAAVQDNFQQGVRYLFMVSQSECNRNRTQYADFFQAIYTIAKYLAPQTGDNSYIHSISFSSMFDVLPLSGEWTSWPYIIYFSLSGTSAKITAFRGSQRREGIADFYTSLEAEESEALFNALLLASEGKISKFISGATNIDYASRYDDNVIKIKAR